MRAVLTYHSVDRTGSPVSLDPGTFRRHVEWLSEGPIRVTDVDTLLQMPDDADAVALTFDDGFRNFATEAWPLLREHGLPVTLFVVPERVGGDNRWRDRGDEGIPELELLDWSDLRRLAEEGVRLASHGMSHAPLVGLPAEPVRRELVDSRDLIHERTGVLPRGFAYPYGVSDAFVRRVAAACYDWACTTELTPLGPGDRRFALPRLDAFYFRDVDRLEAWGSRRFRWRLRLLRAARRARSAMRDGVGSPEAATGRKSGARERVEAGPGGAPRPMPRETMRTDEGERTEEPALSVVVPAHRAAEELHESLPALLASDLPRERWELIVVNDGADPETLAVARRYADRVLPLAGKPRGPSYARNRGAEVARGEVLAFVDADVTVHSDVLSKFREILAERPDVAAVFGSYDDRPPGPGVVSAYRNLLHHQVHHRNAGEAETFWAGCGAIRRDVFEAMGGYDEWHFSRPQIEDIELGRRIRLAGHRILLRPEIQATHLKRWSLGEVLATDLVRRGIPWMRLVLQEGESEARSTLNLSPRHRWCVALTVASAASVLLSLLLWSPWPLSVALACIGGVTALNLDFYSLLRRRKGWTALLAAVPLHLTHYLSNGLSAVAGWIAYISVGAPLPPVDAAAFREAGLDTSAPLPSPPSESLWYRYDD